MANKVEYGIKNIYYAFQEASADGNPAWETPVHIPGATKLTLDENGSSNPFYADDGIYAELGSAGGLSGSLNMAIFPDDFKAEALGYRIDANGGLVEVAGAVKKSFALGFEFEGDVAGRRNWLYNTTLSRPSEEHNTTEDTITPDTSDADFTASALEINGEKAVKYSLPRTTANAAVYDAFFSKVTTPAAAETE